eukprot:COSAG05_NODE_5165_length_1247_cov_0.881533_1_plen_32_part_10
MQFPVAKFALKLGTAFIPMSTKIYRPHEMRGL